MNQIKFTIPSIPKSINSMYQINYGQRHIYLSNDARIWKSQSKIYVPKFEIEDGSHIGISAVYHMNCFFKNGKVRKVDGPNLDKLLLDTISEKIGLDDSLVFFWCGKKVHSDEDKVVVKMWEIR